MPNGHKKSYDIPVKTRKENADEAGLGNFSTHDHPRGLMVSFSPSC
jgi:hypothetical protein